MAPVPENLDKYFQQLGRKIILELVKEIRLHESQSENPVSTGNTKIKLYKFCQEFKISVILRIKNYFPAANDGLQCLHNTPGPLHEYYNGYNGSVLQYF